MSKVNKGTLESKKINFMKDEGKRIAEENFRKLFEKQKRELENQLENTKVSYENLLQKKVNEIRDKKQEFETLHDKLK